MHTLWSLTVVFGSVVATASHALQSRDSSGTYTLAKEYSGADFFQGWNYYGAPDLLSSGDVNCVNETQAVAEQLAYVDNAGNAIIEVDNTTDIPNQQKRDTIRITSQDSSPIGSVFVVDATHIPYGCSVWPSIWTTDSDPKVPWPDGGEIDIIETVNQMTTNQYSLHTSGTDGCTGVNSTTEQSGTLTSANCYSSATDDDGCAVVRVLSCTRWLVHCSPIPVTLLYLETALNSVGPAFAAANGVVYTAQVDTSGIFIWFWSRADVPASVSSANDSIDVSNWGRPSAAFPASSRDITQNFGPQALVIDITLCGTWAGEPSIYNETCPVTAGTALNDNTCYASNVIGNGTNYVDAYFEIQYIKAFTWIGQFNTTSDSTPSVSSTAATQTASGDISGAMSTRSVLGFAETLGALVGVLLALAGWIV